MARSGARMPYQENKQEMQETYAETLGNGRYEQVEQQDAVVTLRVITAG